jgi:hypothetical protein
MDVVEYVFVDSRTRDTTLYPSGNAYTVYLTNPLKNIFRIDLISAKVPNTLYNLTSGTSVLTINSTNVSLAPGYYSASTLASELTNTGNMAGTTVFYISSEGKYLFYAGSSFTVKANTTEMATLLGIPYNTTITATLASANPVYANNPTFTGKYLLKSSNVADFTTSELLFLDIEELRTQKTNMASRRTGNTFVNSTVAHSFGAITMDVMSGSIKTFKENSDYSFSIEYPEQVTKLSILTVNWRDINGSLVNFNGANNNSFVLKLFRKATSEEEKRAEQTSGKEGFQSGPGLPDPVAMKEEFPVSYILMAVLGAGLLVILLMKK